ncbi:hypothetical protein RI129_007821 [Pyrocoelia pectoralis]|uniref:Rho-GAP domain-containing protein n=1 Tax=Pyrocoelia pectoralis TaxID=417401 RepID=A0AAN7VEA5_9COLE
MADRSSKRRNSRLFRNPSTESNEEILSGTMAKSIREKRKKPKERWLLTRKTWRYMTDAGKRLIPEGVQNRPEDIPKIEAYFQEVCKREPHFLLWRKNSYPGALCFRSQRRRRERRKGGSCRKASSADEIEFKPERPKDLAIPSISGGRFDIQKMKYDFLNKPSSPNSSVKSQFKTSPLPSPSKEELSENELLQMLEKYLTISTAEEKPRNISNTSVDFNYQELIDKLHRHLASSQSAGVSQAYVPHSKQQVHFEGDHIQKSLAETLSRYFGQYTNRDKVISDLLTNRKVLEKLYFDLRRAKGFRSERGMRYGNQFAPWSGTNLRSSKFSDRFTDSFTTPPPLIEVVESTEITYENAGVQTGSILEATLLQLEEEYKKMLAEREEDEPKDIKGNSHRRRSSVDNDDVSQSVSDTIKRYLRMARKKSVDSNKNDRFKRVNYDRNLRNIKAKGEITKPGDDDGLNKGCQTNDDWIMYAKDIKFYDSSDNPNLSSRNSLDMLTVDETEKSPTTHPSFFSTGQTFLSNLLHGKHTHDKSSPAATTTGGAMQKSKSSSSVMHHGSRLMAKKIFRSRSKSQTRPAPTQSSWTPMGGCVWNSTTGKQVILGETTLLQLTDIERKVLQKVALAKLQALNLGVNVKIPTDSVATTPQKPKRRAYLLKRKALTTGFFDANRKEGDKDKDGATTGLVFGIPLSQCVDNDRLSRSSTAATSRDLSGDESNLRRNNSRASCTSLVDTTKDDEIGSRENLLTHEKRIMGSVPGLLDSISSYGSTADILTASHDDEPAVPNILTECVRHLEANGLQTVGIFRVSPSKKRVRQLREDFDCGKESTLGNDQCPHDVATLLKEFLRDLPDPLLCRDLYHAFVKTQRIRNRAMQLEALERLVQLLPISHSDTLCTLLTFLTNVARNAEPRTYATGEIQGGNKMDSNNLATVFAPNILHCNKQGGKEGSERPEDHIDVINVIRTLIDNNKTLFNVPAELLNDVYIHMQDSHPEVLDQLLYRKAIGSGDDYADDLDSESNSAPLTPTAPTSHVALEHVIHTDSDSCNTPPEPRRTWSREEFLHEAAATGGPNLVARFRNSKDRFRERAAKKKRDESTSGRRREDDAGGSTMNIISRIRGQKEDDSNQISKLRSPSLDSNSSYQADDRISGIEVPTIDRRRSTPYMMDSRGVIKASLTIPVQTGNQPLVLNVDHTDIPYIEDMSGYAYVLDNGRQSGISKPEIPRRRHNSESSGGSTVQPITGSISIIQGYDSPIGSPPQTTTSSISSGVADVGSPLSWTSSPPASPDNTRISVNYIPEDVTNFKQTTVKTSTHKKMVTSPTTAQKVTFTSTPELRSTRSVTSKVEQRPSEIPKPMPQVKSAEKFNPTISSIGNAVLRSRTADFERISKNDTKAKTSTTTTNADKKKYTKRRYTDTKHLTRHIPDAESLEVSSNGQNKESSSSQAGVVYKRRELISSVPSK